MMFRKVNKVHFVGIGGIGMSGIAELLINLGFTVSGSDLNDSEIIQNLRKIQSWELLLDAQNIKIKKRKMLIIYLPEELQNFIVLNVFNLLD